MTELGAGRDMLQQRRGKLTTPPWPPHDLFASPDCRPPAAWDHPELSFASSMGPPVRQLWDHPDTGQRWLPLPGYLLPDRSADLGRQRWCSGRLACMRSGRFCDCGCGARACGRSSRLSGLDRKTVRRYVAAARACGAGARRAARDSWMMRCCRGSPRRSGRTAPTVTGPGVGTAGGSSPGARRWLVDDGLTVVKAGGAAGPPRADGPAADAAPYAWRSWGTAGRAAGRDSAGGRRRAGRRMPGRLREDGPALRLGHRAPPRRPTR